MRNEPIKQLDYWVLIFCGIWGLLISLGRVHDMSDPEAVYPFTDYYLNAGVRTIFIVAAALWVAISAVSIWFVARKRLPYRVLMLFLVVLVVLSALPWVELWWGSTFYYGEVRDKHGLHFPWISAIIFSYAIWRGMALFKPQKLMLQWGLIIVAALLQWLLWELVYEPWNLWQS